MKSKSDREPAPPTAEQQMDLARWRAVLDSAQDAIISIDSGGRITLFNHGAERMFGYAAAEVLGHDVAILMPSPYREEHRGYIQSYQRTGVGKAIGRIREVFAQRRNGDVFPIELSVSEARLGTEVAYMAIIRDVSQRKRAEQRLRELQKSTAQRERLADVGAITAKIVHDLGNPLGGISMHMQRIARILKRDQTSPASAIAEPLERIGAIVRRLHGLVGDFMNFAREQRLDVKPITLQRFLAEIIDEWGPLAAVQGIALTFEAADAPREIRGDVDKLRRVVENLIKNAIEAIGEGPGTVTVQVSLPRDGKVRLAVLDTGPGVAESIELFQLFETTKPEGSGFGLAIAKQIMLAHGGDIHFTPRQPRGAIFSIELPYNDPDG